MSPSGQGYGSGQIRDATFIQSQLPVRNHDHATLYITIRDDGKALPSKWPFGPVVSASPRDVHDTTQVVPAANLTITIRRCVKIENRRHVTTPGRLCEIDALVSRVIKYQMTILENTLYCNRAQPCCVSVL